MPNNLRGAWRERSINAGLFGYINADSDIGKRPFGLSLLDTLQFKGNPIANPALVARIETLWAVRVQFDDFV